MLQTERILIRPARTDDAAPLFAVFGDAETMLYWDSLPDADPSVTASRVAGLMRQTKPVTYFVFETENTPIGTGGVHQGTELGFILNRTFWRQGLALEALTALIPHLFSTLDTDHLTADVDPHNAASLSLLDRLGFVKTGTASRTFQIGDRWCDSVYLRLDREST